MTQPTMITCDLDQPDRSPIRRAIRVNCSRCKRAAFGCPHALEQARNDLGRNILVEWVCHECLADVIHESGGAEIILPSDETRLAVRRDEIERN